MLVDSVLLYVAEVWGSCKQLAPIKKIQLRAASIFLEVRRLHPKVSLLFYALKIPYAGTGCIYRILYKL